MRKGDRYIDIKMRDVWEFVEHSGDRGFPHNAVCIDPGDDEESYIGEIHKWNFENIDIWKYLGNFSKSSNFDTLYDKLNEDT